MEITINETQKTFRLNQNITFKELKAIVKKYGLEEYALEPNWVYSYQQYNPCVISTPFEITCGTAKWDGGSTLTVN